MKKIGILTYHRAINYGALLQGWALREKLKQLGADVYMIDYRCPFIERAYRLTRGMEKQDFRSRLTVLRGIPEVRRKTKRFRRFAHRYLGLTEKCERETAKKVCSGFDAVITGSDQVWNMKLCGEDRTYLLDFFGEHKADEKQKQVACQKYSYAVSLGDYTLTPEEAGLLADFRELSLREKRTAEYVARETGRKTRVDIDPTLLLSREQWEKLVPGASGEAFRTEFDREAEPANMKSHADGGAGGRTAGGRPYIFIYSVHPQNRMVAYAKKLAKEKNYDIIHLHNRVKKDMREDGVRLIFDSSPEEFLSLIYHAACVVTNSFHGTVFSILFQRPFLSELETKAGFNNRVWELLQTLGIPRRILDQVPGINDGVIMDEPIDWELTERKRREQAGESVKYLASIIDNLQN
ncbi:MAG: polysaccharide pyruvyl transferase family protein [Lachnospiraceae bacterium]|nr:polysaccharide pyruvyl transferase family protein [Lachnospiraceae bacterium]